MKKVNPRRKPVSQADIEKIRKITMAQSLATVEAVFLTVLMDKFGLEDRINEIWTEVNKLSDEIKEGRVSLKDLRDVLSEEYGIEIMGDLK